MCTDFIYFYTHINDKHYADISTRNLFKSTRGNEGQTLHSYFRCYYDWKARSLTFRAWTRLQFVAIYHLRRSIHEACRFILIQNIATKRSMFRYDYTSVVRRDPKRIILKLIVITMNSCHQI